MTSARFVDLSGMSEDRELPAEIFDVQVNVPVMHEVVRAQLASARAGTHATKTRGDVAGGGAKPWRQKGLGRARHGSIREPQWRGGGIAHGPQPRDHSIRVNRKTRALALRSALTDRAREGKVLVVDLPEFEEPRTRRAVELLEEWGAEGRVLLVAGTGDNDDSLALLSFRNLPEVELAPYPTAYLVLSCDTLIFTRPAFDEFLGTPSRAEPPATESPAVAESPEEVGRGEGPTEGDLRERDTQAEDLQALRDPGATGIEPEPEAEPEPRPENES